MKGVDNKVWTFLMLGIVLGILISYVAFAIGIIEIVDRLRIENIEFAFDESKFVNLTIDRLMENITK